MKYFGICISLCAVVGHVASYRYHNETVPDPASQQVVEFRSKHPRPIGVVTRVTGEPLDIRDWTTMNTDLFISRNHFRHTNHFVRERIPERVVFAKGTGAFGYFQVTNDVSKYIRSDVFNGIGKRTPLFVRFGTALQNLGGSDLTRELKGMSIKMYTKEGNLDFVCSNVPVFPIKDPLAFSSMVHAFKRNPRTDIFDFTARWDIMNSRTDVLHTILYLSSDMGLPDGYRKINSYAGHAYEVFNKHGDRFYVKFNFRTEIGLYNLTDAQAQAITSRDPDYYNRDLYNAIASKNYPSWSVEMDIMRKDDVLKFDYDPFDTTRLWKRGTYHTVTVGRIVLNRLVDNHFRDVDQSAFNPDNLVPGIMGPVDYIFRARKIFYADAQNYRLGVNAANIRVNAPLHEHTYSRDGRPPVLDNMRDVPNYFPNSFNGPMPYVDEKRRNDNIEVYHRNAVDLQPMSEFYNEIIESNAHRQRLANVLAVTLRTVPTKIEKRSIRILTLIDTDLGRRVKLTLEELRAENEIIRRKNVAQCLAHVVEVNINKTKHLLHDKYYH